jgi:hypothetical protein
MDACLHNQRAAGSAGEGGVELVRIAMAAWMVLALILFGLGVGWASDKDEAIVTVQVTSADHELQEGYFSLGENTTLVAKPGSDLHRFLSRQRGKTIKVVLTEADTRELSQLRR